MAGAAEELSLAEFADRMKAMGADVASMNFISTLKQCKQVVVQEVKENFDQGHTPENDAWRPLAFPRANSKGGDLPLRMNGFLMASVTANGRGHIEELTDSTLVVGTNLEYAKIHQEGGTITPKGHPFLAIPLTPEASRAGSPRNFGADLVPIIGGKGGVLIERRVKGKGARQQVKEIAQYALVRSVVIPARRFLGFSAKAVKRINEVFAKFVAKVTGGGKGESA